MTEKEFIVDPCTGGSYLVNGGIIDSNATVCNKKTRADIDNA